MVEGPLPGLLRDLHEALGDADALDDESRQLLAVVARDIEALSARSAAVNNHIPALERIAVQFDSDHPGLSAVARQLIDALGKAGI